MEIEYYEPICITTHRIPLSKLKDIHGRITARMYATLGCLTGLFLYDYSVFIKNSGVLGSVLLNTGLPIWLLSLFMYYYGRKTMARDLIERKI